MSDYYHSLKINLESAYVGPLEVNKTLILLCVFVTIIVDFNFIHFPYVHTMGLLEDRQRYMYQLEGGLGLLADRQRYICQLKGGEDKKKEGI